MRRNILIIIASAIGLLAPLYFLSDYRSTPVMNDHYRDSLQTSNDSLRGVLAYQILVADSLHQRIRQRNVLIRLTKLKCNRYANIVKKNPSQSIFIVAWIDRSFQWVDERDEE